MMLPEVIEFIFMLLFQKSLEKFKKSLLMRNAVEGTRIAKFYRVLAEDVTCHSWNTVLHYHFL